MAVRGNPGQEEDQQRCENGYRCLYESEDGEDLKCSSCEQLLRKPHTTTCCGKNFCQAFLQGRRRCPDCSSQDFQSAYNSFMDKIIQKLKVLCGERGCQWEGRVNDLDTHRTNCDFVEVFCEKCCEPVRRAHLETHNARECPKRPREPLQQTACQFRPVGCEAMLEAGGVAEDEHIKKEVSQHVSALYRYTLELATKVEDLVMSKEEEKGRRKAEELRRKRNEKKMAQLDEDINRLTSKVEFISQTLNNPPEDEISPPEVPATEDRVRMDLDKRLEEKEVQISQLEQSLKASKAKDQEMETRLSKLESNLRARPMEGVYSTTLKMEEFATKKRHQEGWRVPIFENEPGLVHKLILTIWPNGQRSGRDTHISAWLEQDASKPPLPPAHVFVFFELLNQFIDGHHNIEVPCHFPINHGRYVGEICNKLVKHRALDYDPDEGTQFLVNDSLKFRIQIFIKTVGTSPLRQHFSMQ